MTKSAGGEFKKIIPTIKENVKADDIKRVPLAEFIQQNTNNIINEWVNFAQTLTPAASHMTVLALRDHIPQILSFIINDIKSPQTSSEQKQKSQGKQEKEIADTVAEIHAALRLADGFNIDQMVSEWRALRASVIKLWVDENIALTHDDVIDLIRFNEAIDQELAESVSHFTEKVTYSKDLFIGMLSHELRNPLNVISMAAHLQSNTSATGAERHALLTKQITESALRATKIVDDLLDVTRARFGSGIPVMKAPMDMGYASKLLIDEMKIAHPTRNIILDVSGDVKGDWDQARIGQVFANLLGNAIQYSSTDSPIDVTVKGSAEEVVISVYNEGDPIPPEKIKVIFNSLTRAITDESEQATGTNLGLGLYITKQIIISHGGKINVTSSKDQGTSFTIRLPKSDPKI